MNYLQEHNISVIPHVYILQNVTSIFHIPRQYYGSRAQETALCIAITTGLNSRVNSKDKVTIVSTSESQQKHSTSKEGRDLTEKQEHPIKPGSHDAFHCWQHSIHGDTVRTCLCKRVHKSLPLRVEIKQK